MPSSTNRLFFFTKMPLVEEVNVNSFIDLEDNLPDCVDCVGNDAATTSNCLFFIVEWCHSEWQEQ